jgi:hypothetical protein
LLNTEILGEQEHKLEHMQQQVVVVLESLLHHLPVLVLGQVVVEDTESQFLDLNIP